MGVGKGVDHVGVHSTREEEGCGVEGADGFHGDRKRTSVLA